MNIIIYGIGKLSDRIYSMLIERKHKVVGYTDSYSKINIYNGIRFFKLIDLQDISYDYIIITTRSREITWEIMNTLVNKYGIEKKKVIPYSIWEKSEIVENVEITSDLEGIILGNSHAYFGFLPPCLNRQFVNLACPSQDIYYNCKAFEKFINKNVDLINKMKVIVFDLYDYNFFNVDLSRTKGLFDYFACGGLIDKCNYEHNVHYSKSFEKQLFEEKYMITQKEESIKVIMSQLFGNYVGSSFQELQNNIYNRENFISEKEPLPVSKLEEAIVENRYEQTINENKDILFSFVNYVHLLFPKCKIVFTLIPRYRSMEKFFPLLMKDWQDEFMKTLNDLLTNEYVYFINYKNVAEIKDDYHLYFDINHLNTIGGKCLSSILNEDLKKII